MDSNTAINAEPELVEDRLPEPTPRWIAAVADLVWGLYEWRIWWVLAASEIRQRYRRSKVGQLWFTLSMGAMIAGIGVVYSVILNQSVSKYIPFIGVGLIVWNLLSGLINNLAICFISADTHLRSYPSPRSTIIYRTIARDFLISAHNLLIVPILIILFKVPVSLDILLVIPALVLVAINAIWIGMLLGPLCTRYRDLPQIISTITQLAFFVTPVLYRPALLSDRLWAFTHLNPFASFVDIVRAPLLGQAPEMYHWLFAVGCTVVGWAIALPFYARFRGRIVYWL